MRKKLNYILNIIIGTFIGIFVGSSIYTYWKHHARPELYALTSAPWYTGIVVNGLFTGTVVMIALAVKLLLQEKKRFLKEYIILVAQLGMFYLVPLFTSVFSAKLFNGLASVVMIIAATFVLSWIMGYISKEKVKYLYPIVIAVLFIPSVYLYYNESAWVHAVWYLMISTVDLLIGMALQKFTKKY